VEDTGKDLFDFILYPGIFAEPWYCYIQDLYLMSGEPIVDSFNSCKGVGGIQVYMQAWSVVFLCQLLRKGRSSGRSTLKLAVALFLQPGFHSL